MRSPRAGPSPRAGSGGCCAVSGQSTGGWLVRQGRVRHRGHDVWYGIVDGGDQAPPLLVVHGGPGIPHDYLEPLERLATDGRSVVHFDQLGCGRSDRPEDPALWTVETFSEEIDVVRRALGLTHVHLFAHSIGGTIALDYLSRRPVGVHSAVLASAVPSIPLYVAQGLDQFGPPGNPDREVVTRHEEAGTVTDPEYRGVLEAWMQQRMMRAPLDAWPEPLTRAFAGMGQDVYATMWDGPQFRPQGTLRDVDLTDRLPAIEVPVLLVHGEHDYVGEPLVRVMLDHIPDVRLHTVRDASHMPWFENPEPFFVAVADFLAGATRSV